MTRAARRAGRLGAALTVLFLAGLLAWLVARPDPADPIVGSWTVTAPAAPFPYHVFTFHQDGNPLRNFMRNGLLAASSGVGGRVRAS